jgi:predicted MFS family arabinose efflux permease
MGCGLLAWWAMPFWGLTGVVALFVGFGTYLFHYTLQTHATQMAPAVRRTSVAPFAFCLLGGQAASETASGAIIDSYGFAPLLLLAAIGLVGAVFGFTRALQRRPN